MLQPCRQCFVGMCVCLRQPGDTAACEPHSVRSTGCSSLVHTCNARTTAIISLFKVSNQVPPRLPLQVASPDLFSTLCCATIMLLVQHRLAVAHATPDLLQACEARGVCAQASRRLISYSSPLSTSIAAFVSTGSYRGARTFVQELRSLSAADHLPAVSGSQHKPRAVSSSDQHTARAMGTQESYSIWLMPGGGCAQTLQREIHAQAHEYSVASFEPHVTLLGGIKRSKDDVLAITRDIAAGLQVQGIC